MIVDRATPAASASPACVSPARILASRKRFGGEGMSGLHRTTDGGVRTPEEGYVEPICPGSYSPQGLPFARRLWLVSAQATRRFIWGDGAGSHGGGSVPVISCVIA